MKSVESKAVEPELITVPTNEARREIIYQMFSTLPLGALVTDLTLLEAVKMDNTPENRAAIGHLVRGQQDRLKRMAGRFMIRKVKIGWEILDHDHAISEPHKRVKKAHKQISKAVRDSGYVKVELCSREAKEEVIRNQQKWGIILLGLEKSGQLNAPEPARSLVQ